MFLLGKRIKKNDKGGIKEFKNFFFLQNKKESLPFSVS